MKEWVWTTHWSVVVFQDDKHWLDAAIVSKEKVTSKKSRKRKWFGSHAELSWQSGQIRCQSDNVVLHPVRYGAPLNAKRRPPSSHLPAANIRLIDSSAPQRSTVSPVRDLWVVLQSVNYTLHGYQYFALMTKLCVCVCEAAFFASVYSAVCTEKQCLTLIKRCESHVFHTIESP